MSTALIIAIGIVAFSMLVSMVGFLVWLFRAPSDKVVPPDPVIDPVVVALTCCVGAQNLLKQIEVGLRNVAVCNSVIAQAAEEVTDGDSG